MLMFSQILMYDVISVLIYWLTVLQYRYDPLEPTKTVSLEVVWNGGHSLDDNYGLTGWCRNQWSPLRCHWLNLVYLSSASALLYSTHVIAPGNISMTITLWTLRVGVGDFLARQVFVLSDDITAATLHDGKCIDLPCHTHAINHWIANGSATNGS